MGEPDYGKRADDLADAMRRYLIGINTGGIAVSLTFASGMVEKGVHPGWVMLPVSLFALGLGISGASLLYAKHKALKRKKASEEGKEIPQFDAWCQRNFIYEFITLAIFLIASGVALFQLEKLELVRPGVGQQEIFAPSNEPSKPPVK
jgi:hypothetical protein